MRNAYKTNRTSYSDAFGCFYVVWELCLDTEKRSVSEITETLEDDQAKKHRIVKF